MVGVIKVSGLGWGSESPVIKKWASDEKWDTVNVQVKK